MFPVVRRDRCDPDKPFIVCDARRDAELNAEMWWDSELRAYVTNLIPRRSVSWRTRFYHPKAGIHDGEPYQLERCLFCGVSLPDIAAIADSTACDGESGG